MYDNGRRHYYATNYRSGDTQKHAGTLHVTDSGAAKEWWIIDTAQSNHYLDNHLHSYVCDDNFDVETETL